MSTRKHNWGPDDLVKGLKTYCAVKGKGGTHCDTSLFKCDQEEQVYQKMNDGGRGGEPRCPLLEGDNRRTVMGSR